MKSISSGLKLAIDIDLTLCGGLIPRLKKKGEKIIHNEILATNTDVFLELYGY